MRVHRLAHALRRLGIGRGDGVAYLGANHPAFLETLFAPGVSRAVFVPLAGRVARYKIPKSVWFVEELPRTPTGKILKRELRQRFGGATHEEVP